MDEQRLIIVTGGGHEAEYARKLLALLSECKIEGVLWTEKEFESNRPTLSNTQLVVFFGLGRETLMQANTIREWSYNLYGCKIGILGNICVVTAQEKDLPGKDLQEFAFYCEERFKNHSDIVVPVVPRKLIGSLKVPALKNKEDKSVWKAQYSVLVYEFIENWLNIFINGKSAEDT